MKYMGKKNIFKHLPCILLLFVSISPAYTRQYQQDFTLAPYGIFSPVTGTYSSHLHHGFGGGIDVMSDLPWLNGNLSAGLDMTFLNWYLKESTESSLFSFSTGGFLDYVFPVNPYFSPFGGVALKCSYLSLDAHRLEKKESTFRPSPGIRFGFYSSIYRGIGLRVMYEHNFTPLSERLFQSGNLSLGVTLNWKGFKSKQQQAMNINSEVDLESLYARGQTRMDTGNLDEAEQIFRQILEKNPDYDPAIVSSAQITAIRSCHEQTRSLISRGQNLEAIQGLEDCSRYYPEDRADLERIRMQYSREIPVWEVTGVSAYDKMNYTQCITVMQKILLVDPGNKTAKIYLPRAQQRQRALERFE